MKAKSHITEEERQEFRQSQKQVTRLKPVSYKNIKLKKVAIPLRSEEDWPATDSDFPILHAPLSAQDTLKYNVSGVNPKTLKQLKQGKLPQSGQLDLHGMNVEQAHEALFRFIHHHQSQQGHKTLLIIHGKGLQSHGQKPVLKNALSGWLQQDKRILAYHSAQAHHGGTGAIYVLIRKKRQPL